MTATQADQPEQREDLIAHMVAGLLSAYQFFWPQREAYAGTAFKRAETQCLQDRAKRPVPLRVGEEMQEVLRRGDGELRSQTTESRF